MTVLHTPPAFLDGLAKVAKWFQPSQTMMGEQQNYVLTTIDDGYRGSLRIYDGDEMIEAGRVSFESGPPIDFEVMIAQQKIVTSSLNGTVHLVSYSEPNPHEKIALREESLCALKGKSANIPCTHVSIQPRQADPIVAACSESGFLHLLKSEPWACLQTIDTDLFELNASAWHDQNTLLVAAESGQLKLVDIRTSDGVTMLLETEQVAPVNCIALNPMNTNLFVCGDDDGLLYMGDLRKDKFADLVRVQAHASPIRDVTFFGRHESKQVASVAFGGELVVCSNALQSGETFEFANNQLPLNSIDVHPQHERLVIGCDGSLVFLNLSQK